MSEWKEYKFSQLCDISRGASPRPIQKYLTKNEGMPWVKIADATSNSSKYITHTNENIKLDGVDKSVKVYKGDLILSNSATPGLPKIMGIDACIHDGWMLLRNFKNITKEFTYWLLLNERKKLVHQGNGSVFINLKTDILKSHIVKIPDIKTQNKIVLILDQISNKIELNTQTNQTLEQIAQGIFKHWFIDFAPVHAKANALARGETIEQAELAAMACLSGKTVEKITALKTQDPTAYHQLQQTAQAFPNEFVESEMGLVPKGWEVKKIDEVIQKIPVGKKYNQKTTVPDGKIPVLDQGKSGIIGFHNDTAGVNASIQDPVIVFANHTCYMRLIHFDFSAIQNVFAFKGKNINIYWIYLATLGKQKFVEYKGHFPDFLIKQIVVPPKELTEIFGDIVKDSFSKIALNLDTNEKLAKTRDLLLPRLLSGEIEL